MRRTLAAIQFMFEIHWSFERLHLVQCSVFLDFRYTSRGFKRDLRVSLVSCPSGLRGQSGMLMGSARVGSNPTDTVERNNLFKTDWPN